LTVGSFGIVQKILKKSNGEYFVWKILNYGNMGAKEKLQLVSEVNIL
jgi:hypothetical protein